MRQFVAEEFRRLSDDDGGDYEEHFSFLRISVFVFLAVFFWTVTGEILVVFGAITLGYFLSPLLKVKSRIRRDEGALSPKCSVGNVWEDVREESDDGRTDSADGRKESSAGGFRQSREDSGGFAMHHSGDGAEEASRQPEATFGEAERCRYTHGQAQAILRHLREDARSESVRIRTKAANEPLLMTASKFGGMPYWTRGEDFPRDEDGKMMCLLAQINFSDVPRLPDFPERGLLQFFVQAGGTWGLDFRGNEQKNWRIVWRPFFSPGLAMGADELRSAGVRTASDKDGSAHGEQNLPFDKEFSLSFDKETTSVHPNCGDFDEAVRNAAKKLNFPVFDGGALDWFGEDDYNGFCPDEKCAKHQIGGYPDFTQGDVRREGDVLLFQMDSEMGVDENGKPSGWEILWGDCGIANFFVSRADLRSRDFSNALYNWDCY